MWRFFFKENCKSLPFFYFLTFEKGRLLYIHPVGRSVGQSVGRSVGRSVSVTINFASFPEQIRTEKAKVRIQIRDFHCLLGLSFFANHYFFLQIMALDHRNQPWLRYSRKKKNVKFDVFDHLLVPEKCLWSFYHGGHVSQFFRPGHLMHTHPKWCALALIHCTKWVCFRERLAPWRGVLLANCSLERCAPGAVTAATEGGTGGTESLRGHGGK